MYEVLANQKTYLILFFGMFTPRFRQTFFIAVANADRRWHSRLCRWSSTLLPNLIWRCPDTEKPLLALNIALRHRKKFHGARPVEKKKRWEKVMMDLVVKMYCKWRRRGCVSIWTYFLGSRCLVESCWWSFFVRPCTDVSSKSVDQSYLSPVYGGYGDKNFFQSVFFHFLVVLIWGISLYQTFLEIS
jgi:hypothetical protein